MLLSHDLKVKGYVYTNIALGPFKGRAQPLHSVNGAAISSGVSPDESEMVRSVTNFGKAVGVAPTASCPPSVHSVTEVLGSTAIACGEPWVHSVTRGVPAEAGFRATLLSVTTVAFKLQDTTDSHWHKTLISRSGFSCAVKRRTS